LEHRRDNNRGDGSGLDTGERAGGRSSSCFFQAQSAAGQTSINEFMDCTGEHFIAGAWWES